MLSSQLVAFAVVSGLLGAPGPVVPTNFEDCLRNLRSGPESALAYLCLGTPGLPERPREVRATLEEVLRKKPGQPHARLYLAMMRLYAREAVDRADFMEPLQTFDRQQRWVDSFFARLAAVERECVIGTEECNLSQPRNELLDQALAIADRIGHPDLKRLAAIAQLKFSTRLDRYGPAREAEKQLDALPGKPAPWLVVLETSARARLAGSLGNESRVRDLYSAMLAAVPEGSVAHAAALAGVAEATAQLAWQGLADRKEAERLLREALAVQRALELRQWNSHGIGTIRTATVLSLLVGPNADTPRILDQPDLLQFNLEMLLQGDARDRAEAVRIARERLTPETALYLSMGVARAHVEFHAGSQDEAIAWVRRALEGYSILRRLEEDEHTRMSGDFEWGGTYQTMASDLLETDAQTPPRLEFALQVMEELRARVLLERLARREDKTAEQTAPKVPSVAELRSALGPDEALVSFMVWISKGSTPV